MNTSSSALRMLIREAIAEPLRMDAIDEMVGGLQEMLGKLQLEYVGVELPMRTFNRMRAVSETARRLADKADQIMRAN